MNRYVIMYLTATVYEYNTSSYLYLLIYILIRETSPSLSIFCKSNEMPEGGRLRSANRAPFNDSVSSRRSIVHPDSSQ